MKALMIALMIAVPLNFNFQLYEACCQKRFIEEEGLVKVKLSCYLATGNCTADGSETREGIVSCNRDHLGMDCIMYDKDFQPVARFECRDIGGHKLLREGKAIDVFRDSYDRAQDFIGQYGSYAYIKWVDRDFDGPAPVPEYMEHTKIDTE